MFYLLYDPRVQTGETVNFFKLVYNLKYIQVKHCLEISKIHPACLSDICNNSYCFSKLNSYIDAYFERLNSVLQSVNLSIN